MSNSGKRILLIEPSTTRREVLARRLRAQGLDVEETGDAATGADLALASPPAVVISDLWMPGISGVQLCRLLKSEPATADVPVVLCADRDEPRNRFWAERAGATAYVMKGRTADLVRALSKAMESSSREEAFFVQLSGGRVDILDRIARHLDVALFDSIISAELRALASAGSFERLFDLLAQLLSQITRYRWIALATTAPERIFVHRNLAAGDTVEREVHEALGDGQPFVIEDEDPAAVERCADPIICTVDFAYAPVARFALSPCADYANDAAALASTVARELGGAIKIATLVEESQRLAATDPLTGLMNRRAFATDLHRELSRAARYGYSLSLALLDIDHFKQINDKRGHAAGDRVLMSLGELLRQYSRRSDVAARWGGEEFVVAYTSTDLAGARVAAERLRLAVEQQAIVDATGETVPITASIGLATWHAGESLDSLISRADRAMYAAKGAGRNRVTLCEEDVAANPLAIVA